MYSILCGLFHVIISSSYQVNAMSFLEYRKQLKMLKQFLKASYYMMKYTEVLEKFFLLDNIWWHRCFGTEKCVETPMETPSGKVCTHPFMGQSTNLQHVSNSQKLFNEGLTQEHAELGEEGCYLCLARLNQCLRSFKFYI